MGGGVTGGLRQQATRREPRPRSRVCGTLPQAGSIPAEDVKPLSGSPAGTRSHRGQVRIPIDKLKDHIAQKVAF